MDKVRQRVLSAAILAAALAAGLDASNEPRKFYPDDPLWREPAPLPVKEAARRKLSEWYDYFYNTFSHPGERHTKTHFIRAKNRNTMDEVPDSSWYTNRHYRRRMSVEELVRGPGNSNAPATDKPWKVVDGKSEGITPGLRIEDSKGRQYLLKADPMSNPELASSADVIGARFFHALGYNTPENYIVDFQRSQLVVGEKAEFTDRRGIERAMKLRDIEEVLEVMPRNKEGIFRAMASLIIRGTPLGPFRYHGTRTDDPNDVVPHEHRRELRGLYVFASWLNHTDSKAGNTLDLLVEENGIKHIKHYLIDFGATLGSDSFTEKSPRGGNEYLFAWTPAAQQFFSLGFYVPRWTRADYPNLPAVGNFEAEVFVPDRWKGNYETPAFVNCLPDDAFWAARQVMSFTPEEILAIVKTGEYSDPKATAYVTSTLVARRDKIGRTWFAKVLPLDRFAIGNGRLLFEDLAVRHKFAAPRDYRIAWARYSNDTQQEAALAHTGPALPPELHSASQGSYYAAAITAEDTRKSVKVFLRKEAGGMKLVGLERNW